MGFAVPQSALAGAHTILAGIDVVPQSALAGVHTMSAPAGVHTILAGTDAVLQSALAGVHTILAGTDVCQRLTCSSNNTSCSFRMKSTERPGTWLSG